MSLRAGVPRCHPARVRALPPPPRHSLFESAESWPEKPFDLILRVGFGKPKRKSGLYYETMGIVTKKLNHIEAHLNYATDSGAGRKSVPIHDARAVLDQLSLEQQGFILRRHKTAVTNFFDETEVRVRSTTRRSNNSSRRPPGLQERLRSNMTCDPPRRPSAPRKVHASPSKLCTMTTPRSQLRNACDCICLRKPKHC
jgi:hypothetical protein